MTVRAQRQEQLSLIRALLWTSIQKYVLIQYLLIKNIEIAHPTFIWF